MTKKTAENVFCAPVPEVNPAARLIGTAGGGNRER